MTPRIMQCPAADSCTVSDKKNCPHYGSHVEGEACDYVDDEYGCPPCVEVEDAAE